MIARVLCEKCSIICSFTELENRVDEYCPCFDCIVKMICQKSCTKLKIYCIKVFQVLPEKDQRKIWLRSDEKTLRE